MQREVQLADAREFGSSQLKRCLVLSRRYGRLRVEPDRSVSHLYSARERRVVFGRESFEMFKVQAGVAVPIRQRDSRVRVAPDSLEFWSQDQLSTTHSIRLVESASTGYCRTLSVLNRSETGVRLRILSLHDPTSMNFRKEHDPPGDVGVNAFNRWDHVVMDDVGDTTGVRVIGFQPRPSKVYMTKEKQRGLDLLAAGELPDSVAGMSGPILVLAQWDFDLPVGGRADLRTTLIHHPSSLELILSDMSASTSFPERRERDGPLFRCPLPAVNFAFSWARTSMEAIEGEEDMAERLASGFGLQVVRPERFEEEFESVRTTQQRDGLVAGSVAGNSGLLETCFLVINACGYLLAKKDKKSAKRWYTVLRKAGRGIRGLIRDGMVTLNSRHPSGWRRRLGSGFPTGSLSELNLIAARALNDLAQVAYMAGKGSESAEFSETKVKLLERLNRTLRDPETGGLSLNVDPQGRPHKELTVDQAVALSHYQPDINLASSVVHRLLDPDFETGYGPRTVPLSNALYYSPTYGEGQLGGYWTRAALSHALLAYVSGYPSIGCLQLEKVARLVYSECEKMGGVPGEFPYWFDPEKRAVGSVGSDPVASSRFIESLIVGEVGLRRTPNGLSAEPPPGSKLRWLLLHDLALAGKGSLFVGRTSSQVFSASTYDKISTGAARVFKGCEILDLRSPLEGILFWDGSTALVCIGSAGSSDSVLNVSVPTRGKPFGRSLYLDLEELNQESSVWQRLERKKALERVEFRAEVRAGAWKWYRLVQIT